MKSGYQTYGAAIPQGYKQPDPFLTEQGQADFLKLGTKPKSPTKGFLGFSRIDWVAMITIILVPQLIFGAVYALVSFYWAYKYTILTWMLIAVIFAVVAYMGYVAVSRMLKDADGVTDHYAVWAAAIFLLVNLAFFAALIFGYRNYGLYMQPYYSSAELNSYTDIDASSMAGKAFMDAGMVKFKAGSHLDLSKSTGFMNLNMYCVAPIVSSGKAPTSYDFWAVGTNCCTGAKDNFACGQASSLKTAKTTGGLRLMSASELPFYKLAVTQAATNYGVKAEHPIFFHWVQDPTDALTEHRNHGVNNFIPTLGFFGVFQLFTLAGAVMVVTIVMSKYQGKVDQ